MAHFANVTDPWLLGATGSVSDSRGTTGPVQPHTGISPSKGQCQLLANVRSKSMQEKCGQVKVVICGKYKNLNKITKI